MDVLDQEIGRREEGRARSDGEHGSVVTDADSNSCRPRLADGSPDPCKHSELAQGAKLYRRPATSMRAAITRRVAIALHGSTGSRREESFLTPVESRDGVQLFLELGLRYRADDLVHHGASLHQQDRRDGTDSVACG